MTGANTGSAGSGVIVDMEIYDSAGVKVNQQTVTNQTLGSRQTLSFSFKWTPTTAGVYTVKTGLFDSTWNTLYHWNNAAATITVK